MTTTTHAAPRALWSTPEHAIGDKSRLDRLAEEPPDRLTALFTEAPAPEVLDPLEGDPVCRGIVRGGPLVRQWAASPACSWIGKSFQHAGDNHLVGHNRLRMLGGTRALPFVAAVGPSLYDGRPSLILHYDDPRAPSPRWTHAIHDELREIEPGLLAGPAALRLRADRLLKLCWFAIDTTADRSTHRAPLSAQRDSPTAQPAAIASDDRRALRSVPLRRLLDDQER